MKSVGREFDSDWGVGGIFTESHYFGVKGLKNQSDILWICIY